MSLIERRAYEGSPDLRGVDALPARAEVGAPHESASSSHGAQPGAMSVRWIPGDSCDTRMLLGALEQAFGGGITQAVADEFGLTAHPDVPLSARKVQLALDAAEVGAQAMAGVQFAASLLNLPPAQSATRVAHG
ncbi:hypothetical protein WG922_04295 [Ramlibacter sp. AN1015]|uniref:hypothetical protein n=1 Tax=Ramlibacter sp. AN1015 TaxID=3133428 RepID=UPI0030C38D4A